MNRILLTILAATLAASACGQITISNAVLTGISGNNGVALTNLNASELKSGIIPMGRVAINAATNGNVLTSDGTNRSWGTVPLAALPSLVITQGQSTAVTLSNVFTVNAGSANTLVVTNGRVGIGTSNPGYAVDVSGNAQVASLFAYTQVYGSSAADAIATSTTGASGRFSGGVTIAKQLQCASNGVFAGTITATNGFGVLGTNTAPDNVTVGTTAPDAWLWFTNGGVVFKVPAWKDH